MTDTYSFDSLHVEFFESALECKIVWFHFDESESVGREYAVEVRNEEDVKVCGVSGIRQRFLLVETEPGVTYFAKVVCCERESQKRVAEGGGTFRGIFSPEEMSQLYLRAVVHLNARQEVKAKVNFLYRCKPRHYFREAHVDFADTMVPYLKDNNGQAASPINAAINGLFFSARLSNGYIPNVSPFGDVRFLINSGRLLDPENMLYYFADFYCNTRAHYVTIVICKPGSEANRFCVNHLPLLPRSNNPFLEITETSPGKYEIYVNQGIWVEFLYTEAIPLEWGRLDKIRTKGMGTSVVGGLRHNNVCHECNMYPNLHC